MESTSPTVAGLAGEAYEHFETKRRDDGTEYSTLKGRPGFEWVQDLVREAHAGMLPDDWRYDAIHSALGVIHDADVSEPGTEAEAEFCDAQVDVYTGERLAWLASHSDRVAYVDEACDEFGDHAPGGILDRIELGQYAEAREIFGLVLAGLERHRVVLLAVAE